MFSIEDVIDKIYDYRTRDLFKEVYSSYTLGNYRSAIVMLWTVVICDFIYKLQELQYKHGDKIAIAILDDTKEKQKNPKDPAWENFLIDEISKRTHFLSTAERGQIEYLHQQRHLCAHPILKEEDNLLLKPTKEEIRSLMINSLNAVLSKTPLLSREYIDVITDDLAKREKTYSADYSEIIPYFKSKYMPYLKEVQLIKLMEVLWQFVFLPKNDEEKKHIRINYELFLFIFKEKEDKCFNKIKENKIKYSFEPEEENSKKYFYKFIIKNQKIYSFLSEDTKSLIITSFSKDINMLMPCVFLSNNNIKEHFEKLKKQLTQEQLENLKTDSYLRKKIDILYEIAKEQEELKSLYNFCIDVYCASPNFIEADIYFDEFIKPYYSFFSKEQILLLISKTEKNTQTYWRNSAKQDHMIIIDRFVSLKGTREELINLGLDEKNDYTKWINYFDEYIIRSGE